MSTFLQILGALVLFVILVVLGIVAFAAIKLRSLKGQLEQMVETMGGITPPSKIELNIIESIPWQDKSVIEKYKAELAALGFRPIGCYSASIIKNGYLEAFMNENERVYATIIQFMGLNVVDFFSRTVTDKDVTASNSPEHVSITEAPFKVSARVAGSSVKDVWTAFSGLEVGTERIPVSANDFQRRYEEAYQRNAEYQLISGRVNVIEMENLMAMTGKTFEPGTAEFLTNKGVIGDHYHSLRDQYLKETEMSALDWEKIEDQVIFVPDLLNQSEVMNYFSDFEIEEIPESLKDKTGTELFWAVVSTEGLSGFELLHTLQEPLPAQVIKTPEVDD